MFDIGLLLLAQATLGTISAIIVVSGAFVALELTGNPVLATLPLAFMSIGLSASALFAPRVMRKLGRRKPVFLAAPVLCLAGALLALLSIRVHSFWSFNLAVTILGISQGVVNHFRYAAIEVGDPARASIRLGIVVLGGVVAAYVGPELCLNFQSAPVGSRYAGGFVGLCVLSLVGLGSLALLSLEDTPRGAVAAEVNRLSLWVVARRLVSTPRTLAALAAGVFAFIAMAILMASAPLAIHNHGVASHGFDIAARSVEHHMMSMYAPSLIAGWLLSQFGSRVVMLAGCGILAVSHAIGIPAHDLLSYSICLIALGVGWNLLYVASSYALTQQVDPSIRRESQAIHDFVVFSSQIPASAAAAPLLSLLGWKALSGVFLLASSAMGTWLFLSTSQRRVREGQVI